MRDFTLDQRVLPAFLTRESEHIVSKLLVHLLDHLFYNVVFSWESHIFYVADNTVRSTAKKVMPSRVLFKDVPISPKRHFFEGGSISWVVSYRSFLESFRLFGRQV